MEDGKNKRVHYRIVYPIGDRPTFKSTGHTMDILDVSERGLAVVRPPNFVLARDQSAIQGKIVFQDGESVEVSGKVIRSGKETISIILSRGIPYATIMNQQRQMLKKYGTLK